MMRRALWAAVVCLLLPVAAHARQRAFGYCEDGGQATVTNGIYSSGTVSLFGGNVAAFTGVQASYPACTVTVYIAGTTAPAVIYSDSAGTSLTNPFTAANDGYWFFYADDGKYDVRFSGGGIPSPFTRPDYLLCDGCSGGGGGGASVLLSPSGAQVVAQPAGTYLSVNRFEGFSYADQFASIAAAATDAGTTGGVIVPPTYSALDTYSPPLQPPIWDARRNQAIYAGNGINASSPGGAMAIGAGNGGSNANGGSVTIRGGTGGATSGVGGDITLTPGSGVNVPGSITLNPGTGTALNVGIAKVNLPLAVPMVNDTSTGTTANGLVSLTGIGRSVRTLAGAVSGVIGVCLSGCGISGTAYVAQFGQVPLTLDNTGVPGDYVCISSTSNAQGTDCGTTPPTTQQIGRVISSASGPTYNVLLTVGGGSGGSSTAGYIQANPSTGAGSPLAQILQPAVSSITGLNVECGSGAPGTQPCFIVQSSTAQNLFQVLNNGTIVFGTGSGGIIQTGGVRVAETTVAFASSQTFDLLTSDVFITTLTGNVTSSTLANMPSSGTAQRATFIICQDSTGGHTFSWPTVMRGAMTIGTVAGLCSTQTFVVDSSLARATDAGVINE